MVKGGGPGRAERASVGKRVASASTLFHPPTTLPLLLGPRGAEEEMVEEVEEKGEKGGQGVVSRRKKGTRGNGRGRYGEARGVVARLSAR